MDMQIKCTLQSVHYRQIIIYDSVSAKKKRVTVCIMLSCFLLKLKLAAMFIYKLPGNGYGITSAMQSHTGQFHSHAFFPQKDTIERYHKCDIIPRNKCAE